MSSLCNTGAHTGLLDNLRGDTYNARSELGQLISVVQESRSNLINDNRQIPEFATAKDDKLGNGPASNSNAGKDSLHIEDPTAIAGVTNPNAMSGMIFEGMRNRLLLKYAGIDYEYFNVNDQRYRGAGVA